MASKKLQLMLYGENLCRLTPKLNSKIARIKRIHTTDNCNYLFVDLRLENSNSAQPQSLHIQLFDKLSLETSFDYQLKVREENSAERKGFSAKDAIYLITPDRFANGDPNNDQVDGYGDHPNRKNPEGRHGGDIAGIRQHLDYIKNLGFTQIWINPLLENKQGKVTYHGYATTDFYKVDPRFGSNQEYRNFVRQAKQQGLGVIQDIILNHSGHHHWWMQDLPTKDWINFNGQFVATNHRRETILDPHAAEWDKKHFTDGWFVESMPDLNQRQQLLANYLIQNNIWWIEYAGLSGLRIDTYPYSDKTFLSEFTRRVMHEYPNFTMVGEEWSLNPLQVAYWQKGGLRRDKYQTELNSLMDFPVQANLVKALKAKDSWNSGWQDLYSALATDYVYGDPNNLVVIADNHDMSRILTQLNGDSALTKLALTFIATTRGIPQVYYGTEIAIQHPGTDAHGKLRADFPGGWPGDHKNAFNGENLSAEEKSMQTFVARLFNWRKHHADFFAQAKLIQFVPGDEVYVYFRLLADKWVMVLLNKSEQSKTIQLASYAEILGSTPVVATEQLSGQPLTLNKHISIPPKTGLILGTFDSDK